MAKQTDKTAKEANSKSQNSEPKTIMADSSAKRLQIFSATVDGKAESIASFNPAQAPKVPSEKENTVDNDDVTEGKAQDQEKPMTFKPAEKKQESEFTETKKPEAKAEPKTTEQAKQTEQDEKTEEDLRAQKFNFETAGAAPKKESLSYQGPELDEDIDPVLQLNPVNSKDLERSSFLYSVYKNITVAVTAVWFGFCLYYAVFTLGLDSIAQAQLFELGGLLGVMLTPVALLWMTLSSAQRKQDVAYYSDALKSELHSILFPTEERAQRVHKDIEELVAQSAELATSSKAVLKSIHRARHGLRTELREFLTLTKKGETHIAGLSKTLEKSVSNASNTIASIEKRVEAIETGAQNGLNLWEKSVDDLLSRSEKVKTTMVTSSEDLLTTAKKVTSEATIIQNSFTDTMSGLTSRVGEASSDLETASGRFEDHLARVEMAASKVADSNAELSQDLEEQISELDTITTNATKMISESKELLGEKTQAFEKGAQYLGSKTKETSDMLNEKVADLYSVADHIIDEFEGFEGRVTTQAEKLSGSVTGLNVFLTKIETTGDEAIYKLSEAVSSALTVTENMSSSVRKSADTIATATDTAKDNTEQLLDASKKTLEVIQEQETQFKDNITAFRTVFDSNTTALEGLYDKGSALVEEISGKSKENKVLLQESAERLENTLKNMSSSVQAPLDDIQSSIKAITKAEELLEQSFAKRVEDMTQTNERTIETATKIKEILKGEAQELASLVGQISGKSQTIQDSFNEQRDVLKAAVDGNTEQLANVVSEYQKFCSGVENSAEKAGSKMDGLNVRLSTSYQNLKQYQVETLDGLSGLTSRLEEKTTDIERMRKDVLEDLETIYIRLSETVEQNRPMYTEVLDDAEKVYNKIIDVNASVQAGFGQTLDKLSTTGDSFKSKIEALNVETDESFKKLNTVKLELEDNREVLLSVVDDVDAKTTTVLRGFETQADDIHLAVDQANLKIEALQKSLKEQVETLSGYIGQSVSSIQSVEERFITASDTLSERINDTQSAYTTLREKVKEEGSALMEITESALTKTKGTVSTLMNETKGLVSSAEDTLTNLKQIGDSISVRSMEIDTQLQKATETSDKYKNDLRAQLSAIADASHSSVDQIAIAISELSEKTKSVSDVTSSLNDEIGRAGQTLKSHAKDLKVVSETAMLVSSEATSSFADHTQRLQKASDSAMEHVKKIKESSLKFQKDAFFGAAKFLVESIYSISVDIMRHVRPGNIDEKDMKAYEKGDLTIFTKRLIELGDKFPEAMVREKFSSDNEFRTYVQRYMRQFEELYEQAQENDHGGIMSATFIASDIGKLYLLLCKSTGRTPRGIVKH